MDRRKQRFLILTLLGASLTNCGFAAFGQQESPAPSPESTPVLVPTPRPTATPTQAPKPTSAPTPMATPRPTLRLDPTPVAKPPPPDPKREKSDRPDRPTLPPQRQPPEKDQRRDDDAPDGRLRDMLDHLPPGEERDAFQRNFQRWREMSPEDRKALRNQMEQFKVRRDRIQDEIDKALAGSGLRLDSDQREIFALRYTQERRKLERRLREEMEAERARRLPDIVEQLKREFNRPPPPPVPPDNNTPPPPEKAPLRDKRGAIDFMR
jgi:hypothetical protein